VIPQTKAEIFALAGRTVCVLVFDGDISSTQHNRVTSKENTKGITAFTVTSVRESPERGNALPLVTVCLLPSSEVAAACNACAQAP
jgi:hypothetical protein